MGRGSGESLLQQARLTRTQIPTHLQQPPELTYDDSDEEEGKLNSEYGFLRWEAFAFDKGSQLLSVSRCLYLATFLVGGVSSVCACV